MSVRALIKLSQNYVYDPECFGGDASLLMFQSDSDDSTVVLTRQDWEAAGSPTTINIQVIGAER